MDLFRKARREPVAQGPVGGTASPAAPLIEIVEAPMAPVAASADPDARFVGYIDFIDRSVITGWCYDAEQPDRSLPVEVVVSNGKRRVAVAGLFRQDVKDAGYGTGHHGFCVDLTPLNVKDETFVVRFAESKVAITSTPVSLEPQRALLDGRLPETYTRAMEVLALEARAVHAEFEERARLSGLAS